MKAPERITIAMDEETFGIFNFFKISKTSKNEFTLVLGSDVPKKFVKTELEEIFAGMGLKVEIKEDLAKLRVKVLQDLNRGVQK